MAAAEDSPHLLIVEDEEALAKSMARILKSRGLEADTAFSGAEARQRLAASKYEVVVLDVRLPDESGYGLLGELRALRPDIAVVMISGVDDPELGKAAVEHGAHGYFVKPIGSTELYLAVYNAIHRRNLELEYRANVHRLETMVSERAAQMATAAHIQEGMLPASPLITDNFDVAAHFTPAREISGDFYDWYLPDENRIALTLGDVMGKGLPAAMMMATVRAALRASAQVEDLEQSVRLAARIMEAPLEVNEAFVTVFHALFDLASGDVHYIDAGHGHARILRGSTGQENLSLRGAPIGMFPEQEFAIGWANLKPGDTLLVFSDGLLDLRPDMGIKDVLLPADVRRAETAEDLVALLTAGARSRELPDDVTVLALRRKWNPKAGSPLPPVGQGEG
ncbi:MAG TPA: SpoIIE family protein phosphatase [Candidatus Dormibacteraeota bacterium]|nr:SpoIIE family protein phosphatase [Candidatus Dormibacteraeota bacterium]